MEVTVVSDLGQPEPEDPQAVKDRALASLRALDMDGALLNQLEEAKVPNKKDKLEPERARIQLTHQEKWHCD